ncbi:MAG: hypothetical protein LBD06_01960 [Candidatus Accumulibacter sp.]|jgi:hypothetical protein|nr:hypothetical protein [Accumulibacter sp.]
MSQSLGATAPAVPDPARIVLHGRVIDSRPWQDGWYFTLDLSDGQRLALKTKAGPPFLAGDRLLVSYSPGLECFRVERQNKRELKNAPQSIEIPRRHPSYSKLQVYGRPKEYDMTLFDYASLNLDRSTPDEPEPQKTMNDPSIADQPLTMSSLEISRLVESNHADVRRSIERLSNRGVITLPPFKKYSVNGVILPQAA